MKDLWITPDLIFDGQEVSAGQAVRIVDGKVADLAAGREDALQIKGCLTPGFVDLQVNGGGGVMLNSSPTLAGMRTIANAHRQFGTVAVMPTVITDAPEVLAAAAEAAIAARDDTGIIGIHIEGPHIAKARRGTHDVNSIRVLDDKTMEVVTRLRANDVTVLMTVAPEAASNDQIAALVAMGVIVSLGHTDASADAVESAISAGATCATHLFNAMSPMTSREPGAVGAIINSHLRSGMICDGYHVDDRMIALALRARPAEDLMFLVSDAMATVGGPDQFDLYGQPVRLVDGRLVNAEGNLAGAHITQGEGVRRLVQAIGLPLQQALRMAITTPAQVIGRDDLATLVGQRTQDVVLLSEDLSTVSPLDGVLGSVWGHDAAE